MTSGRSDVRRLPGHSGDAGTALRGGRKPETPQTARRAASCKPVQAARARERLTGLYHGTWWDQHRASGTR